MEEIPNKNIYVTSIDWNEILIVCISLHPVYSSLFLYGSTTNYLITDEVIEGILEHLDMLLSSGIFKYVGKVGNNYYYERSEMAEIK